MGEPLKLNLGLPRPIESIVKRIFGLTELERVYQEVIDSDSHPLSPGVFCRETLRALKVTYSFPDEKIAELKELKGPLIFIANHPFGAVEAVVLMTLMTEVRAEFKFIANAILHALPELRPVLLPVEIMGDTTDAVSRRENARLNIAAMKSAYDYLQSGGMLGVFPSGEVSARKSLLDASVIEKPWHPHIARMILKTKATVVPVYFKGRNTFFFQLLSLNQKNPFISKLRIALLARELVNRPRALSFTIQDPLLYEDFKRFSDPVELTQYLRDRTLNT